MTLTIFMNVCFIRAWFAHFMYLSLSLSLSAALNGARRAREECWPSFRCVTSEWASFMRLPECHSHVTMNCEQDFGDGGLGVTLTLRLLMHGKVRATLFINERRGSTQRSLKQPCAIFENRWIIKMLLWRVNALPPLLLSPCISGGRQHHRKGESLCFLFYNTKYCSYAQVMNLFELVPS